MSTPTLPVWPIPVDLPTYLAMREGKQPFLLTPVLGYQDGDAVLIRPTAKPLAATLAATPPPEVNADALAAMPALTGTIATIARHLVGLAPGWCVIGLPDLHVARAAEATGGLAH